MIQETPLDIQIKTLPTAPGVYQFFDKNGTIIYVGKAKNIKKRVTSYFTKKHTTGKTQVLVKKIARVKPIVVATESDALLLENNFIKTYKPRYNVLLKDDKSYPWICLKNERFPRIFATRRKRNDGSEYFGPYTSMKTVHTLLNLIRSLYTLRSCAYDLSEKNIAAKKYKVCLEYHLKNCKGACEGKESIANYSKKIIAIRGILKGNFKKPLQQFKLQMDAYANNLLFEEAQQIKEKIEVLKNYQAKSTVVNPKINNVDVFSIVSDSSYAYINFLQVSFGAIIRSHTLEIKKRLEETDEEMLPIAITELRQRFQSNSKQIILPFPIAIETQLKQTIPKLGDKKHLLDLSTRNAKYYRMERFKQIKITHPTKHENRIMQQMQKDLRLKEEPRHIECFDNSNIQGTNAVAACVVFKNGKPSKKDYRHFNIKTVTGPNDYASMEEVVYRRYKRLLEEHQPLPQLIIIDGGKGQLSAALKSLDTLQLRNKIAILGIAKRLEELFYPNDPIPLYLDKKSETLKIIQQLRNEAHRFGITHHRDKRSKNALQTELQTIPGVGEKTIIALLKTFKSTKRIAFAKIDEMEPIIGKNKAELIYNYYHSN